MADSAGVVAGQVVQSLYGTRKWVGAQASPLLFTGQYEDTESGWVYNRFRFYQPVLGSYNAQDPLGLAPRVASGQGYVDHAAHWVDALGLMSRIRDNKTTGERFEQTAKEMIRRKMGRENWADQVTTRVYRADGSWKNSRADFIVRGNDGQFHFIEIKSGNAKLTEGQQLVRDELAKDGGAVEMRSRGPRKLTPLRVGMSDLLQGQFHTFYLDQASHVEMLGILLGKIA
ncbi:hypothetical protein MA47_11140 [Corynebacterium auriscanis]|uniref:Uncharacterized protein n=1 Tax=Corynebacterium auriscanis TaxID=99807 RepID=A0A0A2DM83_9CORY|nr:hypothetical protein MA47_11140 [Corynebacterium auriscanis]